MSGSSKINFILIVILYLTQQVLFMKSLLTTLSLLLAASSLSGCNIMQTNTTASACEQGIQSLNRHLKAGTQTVQQTNLSRANSLLVAAQIQHQFAEYPGCVEKIKRAQDYLSGRQTAIISRLSI